MAEGHVKRILQAEGLALLLAALVAYQLIGKSWWIFAVLFLAPDISFSGYLLGPRVGTAAYNVMHSTILPFVLAGLAWWFATPTSVPAAVAAIWFAHIGFDRAPGYGLEYASGFKDTHLGKL